MNEIIDSSTPERERLVVVVEYGGGRLGAFTIGDGVLMETVERTEDGAWDWESAGECDPVRGSDPDLQEALRLALEVMTRAASRDVPDTGQK